MGKVSVDWDPATMSFVTRVPPVRRVISANDIPAGDTRKGGWRPQYTASARGRSVQYQEGLHRAASGTGRTASRGEGPQ